MTQVTEKVPVPRSKPTGDIDETGKHDPFFPHGFSESPKGIRGAGGQARFWLAPAYLNEKGKYEANIRHAVRFNLLPARNSYFDRQGQRIPGAGAGMQFKILENLAKLKIPGARPVYQQMGVDEEVIEMVGAFAGFDIDSYEETLSSMLGGVPKNLNAFEEAQELLRLISHGQKFAIILSTWEDRGMPEIGMDTKDTTVFDLRTHADEYYIGYAKICELALAHEQRVYWRLVVCVTNDDHDDDTSYGGTIVPPKADLQKMPNTEVVSNVKPTDYDTEIKKLETMLGHYKAGRNGNSQLWGMGPKGADYDTYDYLVQKTEEEIRRLKSQQSAAKKAEAIKRGVAIYNADRGTSK